MPSIRSLCGQCAVGCGLRARAEADRNLWLEGDPTHPVNAGRLCARGRALEAQGGLDDRLLHPLLEGRAVGWDRAIAYIARRLSTILSRHGPGSVALHIGGGLLTEDYYVANKFLKGFCGSAHIHAPWRGTTAAVQQAAFGEDVMPAAIEDIDRADLIVLTAEDLPVTHPVLLDRVAAARERGTRLVVIDPHGTAAGLAADLYLPVTAGTGALLFAALLTRCRDVGALDMDFLARAVAVPPGFLEALGPGHDVWSVARICGLSPAKIRAFHDLWLSSTGAVTIFGEGDVALATEILNLHLATGRVGQPGSTPFALPGAANAMGAREVGCIAMDLAAHTGFQAGAQARVARFWGARMLAVSSPQTTPARLPSATGLDGGSLSTEATTHGSLDDDKALQRLVFDFIGKA